MLSLVFTVKLIRISQRVDGNASMPGVKEVVFLLVFFAVFLFLIQHSFELMQSIYEVVGHRHRQGHGHVRNRAARLTWPRFPSSPPTTTSRRCSPCFIVSLISWVVVLAAYIVALVVCWARALQLYIMAAFSPIPLAFMALDDTRQIGVGYLKNFAAVCIAGLIIVILMIAFPLILGGIVGVNPGTGTSADAIANGLTYALPVPGDVHPAHPLRS